MGKDRLIEHRSVSHAPEGFAARFEVLSLEGTRGRRHADAVSGMQRWWLDSRGWRLAWHLYEELSAADELCWAPQEHLIFPAHGLRATGGVYTDWRLRFLCEYGSDCCGA